MVMGSDGERVLQDTLDTAAQEYKDALSDLDNARADKANNYTDVTALQQQRDQAQEELDKAREEYDDTEIKQLQDDLTNAQKKLAGYQQRKANGEKNLNDVIVIAQDNVDKAKKAYENKVGHQDINTLENQVADLDVKIKEA
jgi:chromosome segregation ATPase